MWSTSSPQGQSLNKARQKHTEVREKGSREQWKRWQQLGVMANEVSGYVFVFDVGGRQITRTDGNSELGSMRAKERGEVEDTNRRRLFYFIWHRQGELFL